jgi:hypothetical protein
MIINIPSAYIGQCREFLSSDNADFEDRSTVITPLRITILSPESSKISFGCNYWKACRNKQCSYCLAGMDDRS